MPYVTHWRRSQDQNRGLGRLILSHWVWKGRFVSNLRRFNFNESVFCRLAYTDSIQSQPNSNFYNIQKPSFSVETENLILFNIFYCLFEWQRDMTVEETKEMEKEKKIEVKEQSHLRTPGPIPKCNSSQAKVHTDNRDPVTWVTLCCTLAGSWVRRNIPRTQTKAGKSASQATFILL